MLVGPIDGKRPTSSFNWTDFHENHLLKIFTLLFLFSFQLIYIYIPKQSIATYISNPPAMLLFSLWLLVYIVCVYSFLFFFSRFFYLFIYFPGWFLFFLASRRHFCVYRERREEMLTGELRDRGGQEVGPANSDSGRSGSSFRRNQLGRSLSQSDVPVTEKNGILYLSTYLYIYLSTFPHTHTHTFRYTFLSLFSSSLLVYVYT